MMYVLDTNAVVDLQTGHPHVVANLLKTSSDDIATTSITIEESLSGWYTLIRRAKTPERTAIAYQRLTESVAFLGKLRLLPFGLEAIARFEELKQLKLGVKHMDLRIAATVLECGGVLVTSNTRDFQNVPELVMVDWRRAMNAE